MFLEGTITKLAVLSAKDDAFRIGEQRFRALFDTTTVPMALAQVNGDPVARQRRFLPLPRPGRGVAPRREPLLLHARGRLRRLGRRAALRAWRRRERVGADDVVADHRRSRETRARSSWCKSKTNRTKGAT